MSLTKVSFSMTDGQVINVLDYGAVADGNEITGTGTDNAAAIQAALNAVDDTHGGTVYFPKGIYATKTGFSVKAKTSLVGDGWDTSTIMLHKDTTSLASTANSMFYLNGGPSVASEFPMRYVHFRRLSLHGLDYVVSVGGLNGIKFRRTIYCTVEDCEIKSFPADGIVFSHSAGEESNTSCVISNCLIRDNNSDGIVIQASNNIQILNNIIRTNSGQAVEFEGDASFRTRISNNLFQDNTNGAILCAALSNYGINGVDSPGSNGTSYVDVVGNKFYANCTPANDPSEEYLGSIHITNVNYWNISNNTFTNALGHGVFTGADYTNISNNYFSGVVRTAICMSSGTYVNISDNHIVACGTGTDDTYFGVLAKGAGISVNSNVISKSTAISSNLPKYAIQVDSGASVVSVLGNTTGDSSKTANFNTDATSVTIGRNFGDSAIPEVASAASISIPFGATLLRITGTTNINQITKPAAHRGYQIVLLFGASLTVENASGGSTNLNLAGATNFSATAGDTLTLISNGTAWYETARSVN